MQGTTDVLHYEGAGFVSVYAGDQRTRFHLRNVPVKLKDRLGDMTDPIGSSTLEGSFVAIRAPQRVQSRLRDLQDVLQKATAPAPPATQ
jgi:hypothetical protein